MISRVGRGAVFALSLAALAVSFLAGRPHAQAGTQIPAVNPPAINQSGDPLLSAFRFRSIGPASMGGRIDDIAVSAAAAMARVLAPSSPFAPNSLIAISRSRF